MLAAGQVFRPRSEGLSTAAVAEISLLCEVVECFSYDAHFAFAYKPIKFINICFEDAVPSVIRFIENAG